MTGSEATTSAGAAATEAVTTAAAGTLGIPSRSAGPGRARGRVPGPTRGLPLPRPSTRPVRPSRRRAAGAGSRTIRKVRAVDERDLTWSDQIGHGPVNAHGLRASVCLFECSNVFLVDCSQPIIMWNGRFRKIDKLQNNAAFFLRFMRL